MQKKDKKHSGWYTPRIESPTMKYSEAHAEAFTPNEEYDEWEDWRDGMRYDPDDKHIRNERMGPLMNIDKIKAMNKKLIKHFHIRKKRKYKQLLKYQKSDVDIISYLSNIK